ncbi:hypothetical protein M0R45_006536 [Rubus argutus]|uniref:Uncharacterized protein n=1 Tax=Rubus argutus TaxID=59490 RepID=A0AAW1YR53_RUBAR
MVLGDGAGVGCRLGVGLSEAMGAVSLYGRGDGWVITVVAERLQRRSRRAVRLGPWLGTRWSCSGREEQHGGKEVWIAGFEWFVLLMDELSLIVVKLGLWAEWDGERVAMVSDTGWFEWLVEVRQMSGDCDLRDGIGSG